MAQLLSVLIAAFAPVGPALAGPPYVTDDPEPTDAGHWENYAYTSGTNFPGETQGEAGLDLNYGAAKDLQLTALTPLDYERRRGYRFGAGDVELAAKYRFLHQSQGDWVPDVAVFPSIGLPTAGRAFGSGHLSLFLPVWVEKDFGKWSTFGGGGYDINPGRGESDFALMGLAVTRSLSRRLNLGVEVYHQTPDVVGGRAMTNLGFGVVYQLTRHLALMGSGGPGFQNIRETGKSTFYASLQLTY